MVVAVVVALGLLRRAPTILLGLLALGDRLPLLAVAVCAGLRVTARPVRAADEEVAFLASLSSHLSAGQSLRHALGQAAATSDINLGGVRRAALSGRPMDAVSAELASALPTQGPAVRSALALASSSGGSSVAVFEALTADASRQLDLRRELRAATAGARFSALLLAGAPIAGVTWRLVFSDSTPSGATPLLAVGGTLGVLGAAATIVQTRRATR